jgi:hypothetical protein
LGTNEENVTAEKHPDPLLLANSFFFSQEAPQSGRPSGGRAQPIKTTQKELTNPDSSPPEEISPVDTVPTETLSEPTLKLLGLIQDDNGIWYRYMKEIHSGRIVKIIQEEGKQ